MLGTLLGSFPQAAQAAACLLRVPLNSKRIERLTERIGAERAAQRDAQTQAWQRLPLVEKERAPQGVKAPPAAAVFADGGRLQLCRTNEDSATHWHEYKAGCLEALEGAAHASDPCPSVPTTFLAREHVTSLTREIGHAAARSDEDRRVEPESVSAPSPSAVPDPLPPPVVYAPPAVSGRDVVASGRPAAAFGQILAAAAWSLGLFASSRKAYVGDGQNWIWTIWEQRFKPFGFVAVLDFVHALTYVFAAATAGRPPDEGWATYERWITWVWRGKVSQVIAELAARQQELGLPTEEDSASSPRAIVTTALTYLQNQQSRMNYPEYRRLGLPITSSHMESTVKQLNQRVKGSEKFWSDAGSEALLQLRADHISASQPLPLFWQRRATRQPGCRNYRRTAA